MTNAEACRRWREKNLERERERGRAYDEANRDKRRAAGRVQQRAYRESGRAADAAVRRGGHLWDRHKLRADDWAALWEAHAGLCYLCSAPLDPDTAVIDHDYRCCPHGHSCRSCRRGLACPNCNTAIGLAGDDPDRLRRMADGLEVAKREVGTRLAARPEQMALPMAAASTVGSVTTYSQGGAGTCGNCDGTGALYDASSCPHCNGSGNVQVHMPSQDDGGDYLGGKDDSFNQPGSGYGLGE